MSKLYYDKSAKDWNEALPIGNGFMGAMVFGDTVRERIQLNEDSVWAPGYQDRTNPDSKAYIEEVRELILEGNIEAAEKLAKNTMFATYPHMAHYQTLGDVWIDFEGRTGNKRVTKDDTGIARFENDTVNLHEYSRELDLSSAIGKVAYGLNGSQFVHEYFASNPNNCVVYSLESDNESLSFSLSATRKDSRSGRGASYLDDYQVEDGQFITLTGSTGGRTGIGFCLKVKVVSEGGRQFQQGGNIVVEQARRAVVYITARTSFRDEDYPEWCERTLAQCSLDNYEKIKAEHICDYQSYFEKVNLVLEEGSPEQELTTPQRLERMRKGEVDPTLLQTYFDYGRYLLIASSREGSLPANLQGIWNEDFEPVWGSKYTININTEMNYWIAEKSGLSDLHLPLLEHLKVMVEKGRLVARKMYGCRGFCCHHNTDIWGDCAPQDQHMPGTIWPLGGAWLSLHIWEHYSYTRDRAFLEEFYPIYRDSVLFFVDYMIQTASGEWITGPSVSPENSYITQNGQIGTLAMGSTMDTEIIRELFQKFLAMQAEREQEDELVGEVLERLEHLPPLKIGKNGQIQEWLEDFEEAEPGHRHISQLFALYPGNSINKQDTPELAAAAEMTLKQRLAAGGGHTGWSKAWIIHFWAHLENGEEALQNLQELLAHSTQENLLDSHPPFQIDGNFGGTNSILEMLVQDYGEKLVLLPATPARFPNGVLEGYRLKNGGTLELQWQQGEVHSFTIHATRAFTQVVQIEQQSLPVTLKAGETKTVNYSAIT